MRHRSDQSLELFENIAMDSDQADPKGYKIVSIRLREAEYLVLARQAAALGISHNLALRIAARRIGGFLEIDHETRALFQDVLRQIGLLSRDILELKSVCARAGTIDMQEFAQQRAAIGREFARLDARLSTILNVSRSRRDGRMILKEEMSA